MDFTVDLDWDLEKGLADLEVDCRLYQGLKLLQLLLDERELGVCRWYGIGLFLALISEFSNVSIVSTVSLMNVHKNQAINWMDQSTTQFF